MDKKTLFIYNGLADLAETSESLFKIALNSHRRFTQQSFLNWCEFNSYTLIAGATKNLSKFNLFYQ